MTVNTQKPIVIFRGDNTAAFDLRTIKILLTGDLDLTNATARFDLLDFTKSWTTEEVATGELSIVFDAAQTKAFALGPQVGTLRLYDMSTGTPRQLTIINKIPFFITNRVCEMDNQSYEAEVCVTSGEVIHVEFNVGVGAVEGKADKVKNATAGDLAGLNAEGNLTDSSIPASDVLRKSQMDSTPTAGSQNPVTSDGIKQAIDAATPSDYDAVKSQVQQNTQAITGIEAKIPAQASAQNQLADKAFVNSSIQTNTATFRGTYNLVTDLGLTVSATEEQTATAIATHLASLVPPIVPENNDYVFVQVPRETSDPTVVVRYDRYKCTVTEVGGVVTRTWRFEFSLNNSSFTADQWAAINSGITSGDVSKLAGIESGAQVNTIETVKVNGAALTPDANKAVDVPVPTQAIDVGAVPLDGTTPMTGALDTPGIYIAGHSKRFQISEFLGNLGVLNLTDGGGVLFPNVANADTLALVSQIYAAVQQIAPEWVSGTTYAADAKVSYNGVVYARKTSGSITSSTNPASDTTNWQAKKVSELFIGNRGDQLFNGTMVLQGASYFSNGLDITRFDGNYRGWRFYQDSNLGLTIQLGGQWNYIVFRRRASDSTSDTVSYLYDIAPEFKTTNTYKVGALVVRTESLQGESNEYYYSAKLYRCVNEHTGAWEPLDFTEATVEDVLAAIRSALALLAPLASPAFTGTPTAPNLTDQSADGQVANKKYVDDKVSGVSVTPLSGQTFDFATMQGIFAGVKACIEALGGSVTNFPAIPANE